MTAVATYNLICDECGVSSSDEKTYPLAKEARDAAFKIGWRHFRHCDRDRIEQWGDKDYCPDCLVLDKYYR